MLTAAVEVIIIAAYSIQFTSYYWSGSPSPYLLSTGPSTPSPPAAGASRLPALSLVGFHLLICPIEGLHVLTLVHTHLDWQDLSHLLQLLIVHLLVIHDVGHLTVESEQLLPAVQLRAHAPGGEVLQEHVGPLQQKLWV